MHTKDIIDDIISKSKIVTDIIKQHKKYNKTYSGSFPALDSLKNKPHVHLPLIVEQLELIVGTLQSSEPMPSYLGLWTETSDLVRLSNQIIDEISELEGKLDYKIATNKITYGQTIIPGDTLFNLARSVPLKKTYEHIEMPDQKRILESFSISFLIRLAIESKLSQMMGFKSIKTIKSNGDQFSSDHFPVGAAFKFLKEHGSEYLVLPVSIGELKKIYDWSCRFVHTGEKEYIWVTLKAIRYLDMLFDGHSNTGISGRRINTLHKDKKLDDLEKKLNLYFENISSSSTTGYVWELSDETYDCTNGFWDRRKNI